MTASKTVINSILITIPLIMVNTAHAHTSGESPGWLHPLSGLDHFLAMISVGLWSSQLGGKAIWVVPSAFVCFMFLGGLVGFEHIELPLTEIGVSLSVVFLGLAIGARQKLPTFFAGLATGLFGVFHGYAHGYEMPLMQNKVIYTLGFLGSTTMLHLMGAIVAHLMLKKTWGDRALRLLGFISCACGIYLLANAVS